MLKVPANIAYYDFRLYKKKNHMIQ